MPLKRPSVYQMESAVTAAKTLTEKGEAKKFRWPRAGQRAGGQQERERRNGQADLLWQRPKPSRTTYP